MTELDLFKGRGSAMELGSVNMVTLIQLTWRTQAEVLKKGVLGMLCLCQPYRYMYGWTED